MKTNYKLPAEFIELNKYVQFFNTGANVQMFGENKYLLLQGSRAKSYSLLLMEGEIGQGRVKDYLVCSKNKRDMLTSIELLQRLIGTNKPYHNTYLVPAKA